MIKTPPLTDLANHPSTYVRHNEVCLLLAYSASVDSLANKHVFYVVILDP
jgi:hypothetical protein